MRDWPDTNDRPQLTIILRIEFVILLAITMAGIILSVI